MPVLAAVSDSFALLAVTPSVRRWSIAQAFALVVRRVLAIA
jgi:hypothetical protein